MKVERESLSEVKINNISGHAIQSVMTRWGLGMIEAVQFVRERIISAEAIESHRSKKKAHQNKYVFRSGDATLIGEKTEEGFNIVTVIRGGRLSRQLRQGHLLRKKVK